VSLCVFKTTTRPPTLARQHVLVEDVHQFVLPAQLAIAGVVRAVLVQEVKVDALLILERQRPDILQDRVGHAQVARAHAKSGKLHLAAHRDEVLVLRAHRGTWGLHGASGREIVIVRERERVK